MLGYEKKGDAIVEMVNQRPFSAVDAEHFLCKAWIVAKSTLGCSRLSSHPKQSSAHTHPSPIIHRKADEVIETVMSKIEDAYCLSRETSEDDITLPEFCRLPEEEEFSDLMEEAFP
jgi:hypothetical protein